MLLLKKMAHSIRHLYDGMLYLPNLKGYMSVLLGGLYHVLIFLGSTKLRPFKICWEFYYVFSLLYRMFQSLIHSLSHAGVNARLIYN